MQPIFVLFGISSLESLAYNIESEGLIASIIDAKNENVYFSLFEHENNIYKKIEDYRAENIYNIINILSKYNKNNITIVGDGGYYYKNLILDNFKNINFANDIQNMQTSISVGRAALDKYLKDNKGEKNNLTPLYLRKSQAERALDGEK